MSFSLFSWIPTVTGRLSFSIIGETDFPAPTEKVNVVDENHRYILCFQKRNNLLDSAIPLFKKTIVDKIWGFLSNLYFVCLAKCKNDPCNDDSDLTGKIFLFHTDKKFLFFTNKKKGVGCR